jgi:hypothetical protein
MLKLYEYGELNQSKLNQISRISVDNAATTDREAFIMILIILYMTDLVQVNATMIVRILIFYTIPYIIKGGPFSRKESPYDTGVLYSIAFAIAFFAASAIFALVLTVPMPASEYLTICGFIAITVAVFIFMKVIKTAKHAIKQTMDERKARNEYQVEMWGPEPSEQTHKEKAEKSKADVAQKQDEEMHKEKVTEDNEPVQLQEEDKVSGEPQKKEKIIEESKTFEVLPWGPERRGR